MFFCFSHTSPSCNSSPRVFFLLDPQVSAQNLEFVDTRLSSPGWVAICLSPWVASTVGYYNQDKLWIYFLQSAATSHGLLCLLGSVHETIQIPVFQTENKFLQKK